MNTRQTKHSKFFKFVRNSIPYFPELRKSHDSLKSVAATVLMQQLEYWFTNHPKGFYKFLEPCSNEKYRQGDSWIEELAYTPDEFRAAFDCIGIRYRTKTEFAQSEDKFQGRFYCSYFDKRQGLTHYFRNHEAVEALLDNLIYGSSLEMGISIPRDGNTHLPRWESQSLEMGISIPRDGNTHPASISPDITPDITPSPQGGADREGEEFLELRNSLTLVDNSESFSKTDNPDPETPQFRRPPFENENHSQRQQQAACDNSDRATQTSQVEKRKRDNSDRTVPAEIPMPDNSQFIGHGNVAPDGATRRFNQGSGKWMSKSSDPWMNSQNPLPEFKDWVYRRAIASGKQYSLANAAGEIRNNYERAGDLWEEYQAELAAAAKIESQRRAAEARSRTPAPEPEPPFEPSQEWIDLGAKLKQISAEAKLKGRW